MALSNGKKLRQLIARDGLIVLPGASTPLLARVVEDIGFEVVYATGAGMANMQFGYPDMGLISMNEMLEHTRRMVDAVNIPVIVDVDSAYGNQLNVIRTVRDFSKAGVAALQIEDQVTPKKCGHFKGKAVITKEEMVGKIKAAKDHMDPDVVLIARTDSIAVEGFEKAIDRAIAYVDAGADLLFIEAPTNMEQLKQIPKLSPVPTLANMVEGGLTPLLTNEEMEKLGFKIALYANGPLKAAIKGTMDFLVHLKKHGTSKDCEDLMITTKERNRLTQMDLYYEYEAKYSAK
jgi:2-methylisocitrate lyase-like PEP mutase family enzyme